MNRVLKSCNISVPVQNNLCTAYCMGKAHQLPFFSSDTIYTTPLELVFTDIWGPAPVASSSGARYYIHFIDAFSKYTWIFLLHSKSQVLSIFVQFKQMAELQLGTKLKCLQSDNAKEYVALTKFLSAEGIMHWFSCPYVHQ